MYTLYFAPGAASLVVHWLLIELDVPYQLRQLDMAAREHKRPEYLTLNPGGVVPTLLVDGEPLYESAALLLYLADAHPQAGFAPPVGSLERGRFYQWMLLMANTLLPSFRSWWYPWEPAGEANAELAKAAVSPRIEAAWDRLDAQLAAGGPWLLGARLTAADFLLVMLMRWSRNMPRPATDWPALRALATRMKARPSFQRLYAEEGLTEWA